MESYLYSTHYDLVTPDGPITNLTPIDETHTEAIVFIENIDPVFVGFDIDRERVFFNIKSTLAQLGVDGVCVEYNLDKKNRCAQVKVKLQGIGKIGQEMLKLLHPGMTIGKLFAADERRRVRDPIYLSRMFGRSDRKGKPLLSLGGLHGSTDLILDKVDGRVVAYLTLQNGKVEYDESINGLLPTIAKGLVSNHPMRELIRLHQEWKPMMPHNIEKGKLLLVKTLPLHIRTVFGRVVNELLSEGYHHTSASILQPDTAASGDIYELFGESRRELTDIPLEFYTLEPYREHVFFEDRDQLQSCLENQKSVFNAFRTAPKPLEQKTAVFIVKGEQILNLKESDWIVRTPRFHDFPGLSHGERQALMVERYIEQQPSYPFLKAINEGKITSQGVLLLRYFPSPMMKRMLLSDLIQRCLKGVYFQYPSRSFSGFFSAEDRALLQDLYKFAIPVFWVDDASGQILQYIQKPDRDSGLFVPLNQIDTFLKATMFGIYGSNLLGLEFEKEVHVLLEGIKQLKNEVNHPLLNSKTPLAMVTGGGPGVMEVGNRVAKELGILSCANIVDFRSPEQRKRDSEEEKEISEINGEPVAEKLVPVVNEQRQNPFIEAKMSYRLDKLVERQAEFNLDFPIFLRGGIGTDFEFCLEEVRRKVGATAATPILLMGDRDYWKAKITTRYQCNRESGTIAGSEWLSNCFYCVDSAEEGLWVYREYFSGRLPIGKGAPLYEEGFVVAADLNASQKK